MLKKWSEFQRLRTLAKKHSLGMQQKLLIYWLCMIIVVVAMVVLLLFFAGTFSKDDKRLQEVISLQLQNLDDDLNAWMEHLTGQGLKLSKTLGREIDDVLVAEGQSIASFNNHAESLLEIQKQLYPILNTALQTCDCNGAYFILDATINTNAQHAATSRSGMYLRYSNLSAASPVSPTMVYFRGIPEIARQENLELHNRWNLEFDTTKLPGYETLVNMSVKRPAEQYFWTERIDLTDTWEQAILLCIPIVGNDGSIYGVCGFEISALYFKLSYLSLAGPFGDAISVLTPIQEDTLILSQGLVGDISGSFLDNREKLKIQEGQYYNLYSTATSTYLGMHQPVQISKGELARTDWQLAVLIPADYYRALVSKHRIEWIIIVIVLLTVLVVLALYLSKRFVRPIIDSLKAMQQEQQGEESLSSGISEIDELAAFLNAQASSRQLDKGELPPNIVELFDQIVARRALLTEAECNILHYYIDGHEISEIPDLAYISMSTVRKHNRSIYKKLGVASRDELMLYIDLLRRCGRLEEFM